MGCQIDNRQSTIGNAVARAYHPITRLTITAPEMVLTDALTVKFFWSAARGGASTPLRYSLACALSGLQR
jgi:hypothetical protein